MRLDCPPLLAGELVRAFGVARSTAGRRMRIRGPAHRLKPPESLEGAGQTQKPIQFAIIFTTANGFAGGGTRDTVDWLDRHCFSSCGGCGGLPSADITLDGSQSCGNFVSVGHHDGRFGTSAARTLGTFSGFISYMTDIKPLRLRLNARPISTIVPKDWPFPPMGTVLFRGKLCSHDSRVQQSARGAMPRLLSLELSPRQSNRGALPSFGCGFRVERQAWLQGG